MSTLRIREALDRAQQVFQQRPSAAWVVHAPARAVWRGGLRCEITGSDGETAVTDMPAPLGGEGAGASPVWHLRAAMASCAATSIAANAARSGIELTCLEVAVSAESDARGAIGMEGVSPALRKMTMSVKIGADGVCEDELRQLAEVGRGLSAVNRTLREVPTTTFEVTVA